MTVVKRTKDSIDILENAMRGVRNSENRSGLRNFHAEGSVVSPKTKTDVGTSDDTPVEREVIVRLPDRRRRQSS